MRLALCIGLCFASWLMVLVTVRRGLDWPLPLLLTVGCSGSVIAVVVA